MSYINGQKQNSHAKKKKCNTKIKPLRPKNDAGSFRSSNKIKASKQGIYDGKENGSVEKKLKPPNFHSTMETVLGEIYSSSDSDILIKELRNLRLEASKLKQCGGMDCIDVEKIIHLLELLQTCIRNGTGEKLISDSKIDDTQGFFKTSVFEKIIKANEGSLIILYILTSANMSKRVYLEDVIDQILIFVKYLIYSTIKHPAFYNNNVKRKECIAQNSRKYLLICQNVCDIVVLLSELVGAQTLTDSAVLQVSSLGILSFYTGIKELQFSSLKLLISVFSKYIKHRRILVDDLLASIEFNENIHYLYKLRAGGQIQILSALILLMVQSTVKISTSIKSDSFILEKYKMAKNVASNFIIDLFNKAIVNKAEDSNCRPVFNNCINDLLITFNQPEWPAAELMLSLLGSFLVSNITKQNLELSVRSISLDYLGLIVSRLRQTMLIIGTKFENIDVITQKIQENDIVDKYMLKARDSKLIVFQEMYINSLISQKKSDNTLVNAKCFNLIIWYQDVHDKLTCIQKKSRKRHGDDNNNIPETEAHEAEELEKLKQILKSKIHISGNSENVNSETKILNQCFDCEEIKQICDYLSSKRPFYRSFNFFLSHVLKSLTENSILMRTKAMKSLRALVEIDPDIFGCREIQVAVMHSLLDLSAQVREAATDLIGKYVLAHPKLIVNYSNALMNRLLDTGLSVRKRVVKLLMDVCIEYPDFPKLPEICVKVAGRIDDEESIKNLVIEGFKKLWFVPVKEESNLDSDLLVKSVFNIIKTIEISNEMNIECFEKIVFSIFKTKEGEQELLKAGKQIVDCLIETIIQVEKKPDASDKILSCIIIIYLVSKAKPQLLLMHVSTIEPYLSIKCTEKKDYNVISYTAKILEQIIPLIKHPSETFLAQMEEQYIKMVMEHDPAVVTTCISCLGSIINNLTKNFKLVRDCFGLYYSFIQNVKQKMEKASNGSLGVPSDITPSLNRSLFVIGLLMQHFDLEDQAIIGGSFSSNVKDETINCILYMMNSITARQCALKALGSACIRYGDLMLKNEIKTYYVQYLAAKSENVSEKIQILNNIEHYLLQEDRKYSKNEEKWGKFSKNEDLKEMADINSGMASSVIQVYLNSILECLLHSKKKVRNAALKLVHLVIIQGLVHPLQIVTYLICICTDEDETIRNMVEMLLQEIETKYPGYIHMKALAGVHLSYEFQKVVKSNINIRGYRMRDSDSMPEALNWFVYSALKTKQQKRSFTMSIVRQFDENTKINLEQMLYLADNLAYFPYRVLDEPLFVIYHIDIILSVSGTNMLQMFQESLLPLDENKKAENESSDCEEEQEDEETLLQRFPDDISPLQKCIHGFQGCLLLGLLKKYLKSIYSISNEKIFQYSPTDSSKTYEKSKLRNSGKTHFDPITILQKLSSGKSGFHENSMCLAKYFLEIKQLVNDVEIDYDKEHINLDSWTTNDSPKREDKNTIPKQSTIVTPYTDSICKNTPSSPKRDNKRKTNKKCSNQNKHKKLKKRITWSTSEESEDDQI